MDPVFYYVPEATTSKSGFLQGLRIAIQPNISVAGWPTDAGSKALANFTAVEDATIVERLRQAGAHICGSTYMSEFGFGLNDSKGGAALRQQVADVELVLDLMGESRLAASRAVVCGFKPSYGLLSRLGLVGLIPSMECCGVLSGSLKNIRNVLKTVAGSDELDFSQPDEETPDFSIENIAPQEMAIGIIKEAESILPAEQRQDFQTALDEIDKAGFTLRELSHPDHALFSLVHKIVGSVEASSCAGRYDSVRYGQRVPGAKNWNDMYLLSRGEAFGSLLKSYLFQGAFFQFECYEAYEDACRIRARLLKDMQRLLEQVDFLVLPTMNSTGAMSLLAEVYAQFDLTVFANVTGQPALYLPASDKTLSGFQLAGPRLSDGRLLALGEFLLNMRHGGR